MYSHAGEAIESHMYTQYKAHLLLLLSSSNAAHIALLVCLATR